MSERPSQDWWESFFDEDYLRLWGNFTPEQRSEQEAEALWSILGLREGCACSTRRAAMAASRCRWHVEARSSSASISRLSSSQKPSGAAAISRRPRCGCSDTIFERP